MPQLRVATPFGLLVVTANAAGISSATWSTHSPATQRSGNSDGSDVLGEAAVQIRSFVEGHLRRFDLPLAPSGSTFQHAVWTCLRDIPYGETQTYGEIAARIGNSARAVGGACGRNPIALIVPCHRVVGAHNRLTGYSGGQGLATKAALLDFERQHVMVSI